MTESDSVLTKSHLPQTCNVFIQNCLAFPVLKSVLKIKEANNRNTCAGSPAAHREAGDALPGHCARAVLNGACAACGPGSLGGSYFDSEI
jgi:hypothetical protein